MNMITITQWDAVVAIGVTALLGVTLGAILMWQHMEGKVIRWERQVKDILNEKDNLNAEIDNSVEWERVIYTDEAGTGITTKPKATTKVSNTPVKYPIDTLVSTLLTPGKPDRQFDPYTGEEIKMPKTKLDAKNFVNKHPNFMDKEMDDNYKMPKAKLYTTIKMDKPKKEKVKKPQDFYTKTLEEIMKKQKKSRYYSRRYII